MIAGGTIGAPLIFNNVHRDAHGHGGNPHTLPMLPKPCDQNLPIGGHRDAVESVSLHYSEVVSVAFMAQSPAPARPGQRSL